MQTQTQTCVVAMGDGGEGAGGGVEWEFEISRCKLLHTKWINSKVLLYSTRNHSQHPVTNHNGKEYEK